MPALSQQVDLPPRYRVVRHIANGGMATVWAAEDSLLERLVAVKVLAAGYAVDEAARRRFTREARAAARVSDHPNVVTIFDIGEHDGHGLHRHGALRRRDGRRPAARAGDVVPAPLALRWLRETASALDAAHAADIVHRDVKPGNLLLDENGRLAVGDFGIASLAGETAVTAAGQVLGTAAYLSPEQARGQAATPASDRYSLAVVAYELLCGRRPFAGDTPMAQARARVESDPVDADRRLRRGRLGAALGPVAAPEDRPQTRAALVDELERALGDAGRADAGDDRHAGGFVAGCAPPPEAGPEWSGASIRASRAARRRRARRRRRRRVPRRAAASPVPVPRAPRPPVPRPRRRRPRAAAGSGRPGAQSAPQGLHVGCAGADVRRRRGGRGADQRRRQQRRQGSGDRADAPPPSPRARRPAGPFSALPPPTDSPADDRGTGGHARAPSSSTPAPTAADTRSATESTTPATRCCPATRRARCRCCSRRSTSSAHGRHEVHRLRLLAVQPGWALRLAGRPADAIPYLQERLSISDYKRGIVEKELATAQAAAGQPPTASGAKVPGQGHGHGKHAKATAGPGGFSGD